MKNYSSQIFLTITDGAVRMCSYFFNIWDNLLKATDNVKDILETYSIPLQITFLK